MTYRRIVLKIKSLIKAMYILVACGFPSTPQFKKTSEKKCVAKCDQLFTEIIN